jgi:hypothetical protein
MTGPTGVGDRVVHGWTVWYTAGLPGSAGAERQAEIAGDLAEHHDVRLAEGWSDGRVAQERLWRTLRGVPADLAWRHDILAAKARSNSTVRFVVLAVSSVASLAVAAFYVTFATYLLGAEQLARQPMLGGLDSYAEELGSTAAAVAAVVLLASGGVILASCVIRPVAPLSANAVTIAIAIWLVLWFWLGAAPLGIVAVAGACVDMIMRTPALRLRP